MRARQNSISPQEITTARIAANELGAIRWLIEGNAAKIATLKATQIALRATLI